MTPEELIRYLRASPPNDLMRVAADMIEAQQVEIRRLRAALEGVLVDDLVPYLPAEYIANVRAALNQQEKV